MKTYEGKDEEEHTDEEDLHLQAVLKEADEYGKQELVKYETGSWFVKIKFRWHYGKYFGTFIGRVFFTFFGNVGGK